MQVLSYSPSCEAYVECAGGRYYDLSPDIVSMRVDRNSNDASTFSITLQNKGWKYNGVFTPMDRIVLYCTKIERRRLLTGYVTDCDVYSLYQGDFKISGKCSLYKVQQWYWDPGLVESLNLIRSARNTNKDWQGYDQTIRELLTEVCNWPADAIEIGDMPKEVADFAREMYQANLDSSNQLKSMADDFYEILRTHGPKPAVGAAGVTSGGETVTGDLASGDGQAVWNLYKSWEGKFVYSQDGDGRLDPVHSGYGDCSSTCWRAYKDVTGIDVGTWTGAMIEKGELVAKGSGDLPIEKMVVGDLILVNHGGYNPTYDHVEMYGGNNVYAGHGGPGMGPTIKQNAKGYGSTQSDWQVRRYVKDVKTQSAGSGQTVSNSAKTKPTASSKQFYDFMFQGIVSGSGMTAGYSYSYYSETVRPGGGLGIKGRHLHTYRNGQGFVCDGQGNIVLAVPTTGKWKKGDVINTIFGRGKFYDTCDKETIDVYVHYP